MPTFCSVQQSNHCDREEFLYDFKAGPAGGNDTTGTGEPASSNASTQQVPSPILARRRSIGVQGAQRQADRGHRAEPSEQHTTSVEVSPLPAHQGRSEISHINKGVTADHLASGLIRLGQQDLGSEPRRPGTKESGKVRRNRVDVRLEPEQASGRPRRQPRPGGQTEAHTQKGTARLVLRDGYIAHCHAPESIGSGPCPPPAYSRTTAVCSGQRWPSTRPRPAHGTYG
jgi:hypothetical protein